MGTAALGLMSALLAAASAAPSARARLTAADGEVSMFSGASSAGLEAREGMSLRRGARLKTGPRSSAEILLEEGGRLYLGESSELRFAASGRDARLLDLSSGILLIKTLPRAGTRLSVRTPSALAAGQGGEFGLIVPPHDPDLTFAGVFERGALEVSGKGGAAQVLRPGAETSVLSGGGPGPVRRLSRFAQLQGLMGLMRRRLRAR